jgi:DNA-binding transcriptional LysR family regulator
MMTVNIAALRAFHAVALAGGFSAAAERLGRTQSTVTIMVEKLERDYGVELVVRRRGKFIALTDIGQAVLRSANQMFSHENDIHEVLRNAGNLVGGLLRIGSTAPKSMIEIINSVQPHIPGLEFRISHANSVRVRQDLIDCNIDIGVIGGKVDEADLEAFPYEKSEIVLIGTPKLFPIDGMTISREDFAKQVLLMRETGSHTRRAVLTAFDQYGIQPGRMFEIATREALVYAAAAGLGLAMIADVEIPEGLNLHTARLEGLQIDGEINLCILKSRAASPMLRRVLQIALAGRMGLGADSAAAR